MQINIIDVVNYMYPDAINLNQVNFRKPDDKILIGSWDIPGVERPTEENLIEYGTENYREIAINKIKLETLPFLEIKIDACAKTMDYDSALSCASYSNSTNQQWKNESIAFIEWRDSVWLYAYSLLNELLNGDGDLPSVEEILQGLPVFGAQ